MVAVVVTVEEPLSKFPPSIKIAPVSSTHAKTPDPLVPRICPLLPSVAGSVHVRSAAIAAVSSGLPKAQIKLIGNGYVPCQRAASLRQCCIG